MIKQYNGLSFNDFTNGDYGEWTQVCERCVAEHAINESLLDKCPSTPICGMFGCQNESDYYLDFPKGASTVPES